MSVMRFFSRTIALAIFATAAVAAPALPPLTTEGLGPVRIGMTVKQAETALGGTLAVQWSDGPAGCGTGSAKPAGDIFYMFENRRLVRIDVEAIDGKPANPAHATAAGIHIGSSEADVKKAYPNVIVEGHPYDEHGHYLRVYTDGRKAGFIFETDGRRVTTFRAGVYPALGYIEGCA